MHVKKFRRALIAMGLLVAAVCAPIATACPPCDEPWTGTYNCTPQDRLTYCCLQTDQCWMDGPFDPWPIWRAADEPRSGTSEVEESVEASETEATPADEVKPETQASS